MSGLSSMNQLPSGGGRTMTSGTSTSSRRAAEGAAGLRLELADFGEHVGKILVVDAADAPQRRKIALRHEIEAAEKRLPWQDRSGRARAAGSRGIRRDCGRRCPDGSKVWMSARTLSTVATAAPRGARRRPRPPRRDSRPRRSPSMRWRPISRSPGIGRRKVELALEMLGKAGFVGKRRFEIRPVVVKAPRTSPTTATAMRGTTLAVDRASRAATGISP